MSTQSDAEFVNAASQDPVPEPHASQDCTVQLLRGIKEDVEGGDAVWHTLALVRELTGRDEEELEKVGSRKGIKYSEYAEEVLKRAVVSIGDLEVSKLPASLGKLIVADRDMLFLAVLKATYGDIKMLRTTCLACNTKNDVEVDLNEDFEIEVPDFDLKEPLKIETNKGTFTVRMPNSDDLKAAQKDDLTLAEVNSVILSRVLVFDTEPVNRMEYVRNLNSSVRKTLIDTLLDIKAGPNLEGVDTQCANCGEELPLMLDWVSLLLG